MAFNNFQVYSGKQLLIGQLSNQYLYFEIAFKLNYFIFHIYLKLLNRNEKLGHLICWASRWPASNSLVTIISGITFSTMERSNGVEASRMTSTISVVHQTFIDINAFLLGLSAITSSFQQEVFNK